MKHSAFLVAALALPLASVQARATSSDWFEADGASLRLVTAGKADADGRLTGMLDIVLKPGWKTYWLDPGDAGVPPQIDVSNSTNVSAAAFAFPAPEHHDDGYSVWAGYDRPVALPVTFTVPAPGEPSLIEASVFLGVCETICVPVQVTFSIDPASDPDNPGDAAAVQAALDALPGPEQPDFGVTLASTDAETLIVEAAVPGDTAPVDFFLAAADGYSFGAPKRLDKDGRLFFEVPVLDWPAAMPGGTGLHYTLVSGGAAVSGILAYP